MCLFLKSVFSLDLIPAFTFNTVNLLMLFLLSQYVSLNTCPFSTLIIRVLFSINSFHPFTCIRFLYSIPLHIPSFLFSYTNSDCISSDYSYTFSFFFTGEYSTFVISVCVAFFGFFPLLLQHIREIIQQPKNTRPPLTARPITPEYVKYAM